MCVVGVLVFSVVVRVKKEEEDDDGDGDKFRQIFLVLKTKSEDCFRLRRRRTSYYYFS